MKSVYALYLFREYLKNRNYSVNTLTRYEREVKGFLVWCEKSDIREVVKEDIYAYRKETARSGRYKVSTQRGIMLSLCMFFRFLLKNDYVLSDPLGGLELAMKKRQTKRESVDKEKLCEFLDGIDGVTFLDLRDRAVFELLYGTGMRVGEAVKLDVTDVDVNSGKLFVSQGKGRKDRVVPVGERALETLKRYVEKGRSYLTSITDTQALFLTTHGQRVKVCNIERALKNRYGRVYPDEKICPHMLRHSFATHMLEAGAGIKQIKDILGHSSIQTTSLYTHFNVESMRKIVKMRHPRENELYEEADVEEYVKLFDR